MASALPVLFVLVIVLGLVAATALFTPKGPNQVLIRTSVMITLVACYLFWMVTYMAQLHPLICLSFLRFPIRALRLTLPQHRYAQRQNERLPRFSFLSTVPPTESARNCIAFRPSPLGLSRESLTRL
ncbi:ATP synthase subunit H-domain-containing protein [Flagelloscypha sp. PMI_526]|nr:ATP synthase subunit H-domain-containing protein [Flagelloscypha sp. PMI_526]